MTEKTIKVYMDTNALRALKFDKEGSALLLAAKEKRIELYLSEWVIYEYARQYYTQTLIRLPLGKVILFFQRLFADHGVIMLPHTEALEEQASQLIAAEETYFNSANINDRRDALILSTVITGFEKDDLLVICEEKKLGQELQRRGYAVKNNSKDFIRELFGDCPTHKIPVPDFSTISNIDDISPAFRKSLALVDPDYYQHILREIDEGREELISAIDNMGAEDKEARIRILGYSVWFSPLTKKELNTLLSGRYKEALIESNIQRLSASGLLQDTGHHLLPNLKDDNARKICEQAVTHVLDELLKLMELS